MDPSEKKVAANNTYMIIALFIHILILAAVSGFVALLLHYKKEYSFAQEHKRSIVLLFLIVITLLMILSTIALFGISWVDIKTLLP